MHACEITGHIVEDVYGNYSRKVLFRWEANRAVYAMHGLHACHFDRLVYHLDRYEAEKRGQPVEIVHGDAVLTNIILLPSGAAKFIDMRGQQLDKRTLSGDALYDFGKVLQSVLGYDFLVSCRGVGVVERKRMVQFVQVLKEYLRRVVGAGRFGDVVLIAASLVCSCLVLHEGFDRREGLAGMARGLLRVVEEDVVDVERIVEIVSDGITSLQQSPPPPQSHPVHHHYLSQTSQRPDPSVP